MNFYFRRLLSIFILLLCGSNLLSQQTSLTGRVQSAGKPLASVIIQLNQSNVAMSDSTGNFILRNLAPGHYTLSFLHIGYLKASQQIHLANGAQMVIDVTMQPVQNNIEDVVVTGTLKEVRREESPVPVEVYTPAFFKKNPTPNIFDALQNVNGVRPQLNCNVCNTGDIHINGLEGPYTMVLIDGMPIVSSLSTVYGLSGIPNSLVERIEIVKGPASSLYGSEAVGGLINIITKKPQTAPQLSLDVFATSWKELNLDLGFKFKVTKKISVLTGINHFKYDHIIDNNDDGFTDVTLQNRISIFQKWNLDRKDNRKLSLAARYYHEDRWGGDTRWNKSFRGGDSIYGESIYVKRWELLGNYQLPVKEKILFSFSYNDHDQDSRYGVVSYIARQQIGFGQLTWDKTLLKHDLLAGVALRYTYYDDNTPGTASASQLNQPQKSWLPGVFLQDEIQLAARHTLLLGARFDHNEIHGNIYTPRLAYKWTIDDQNILRLNAGSGFRVVNLFTEDHAALTGAREVVVQNELKPERTFNVNLNYLKKIFTNNGTHIGLDVSTWYTRFNNRIIGDYDTDPNKIIYDNLKGHAVSKGLSANIDMTFHNGLKVLTGVTFQDVSVTDNGITEQQILTEKFTGTWAISYKIKKWDLGIDYTGNIYGPMRLPLLGELDPRRAYSPVWSIQNIQLVFSKFKQIEIYGGVKNLLNWTPNRGNPFLIARTNDPFDKKVVYDPNGKIRATQDNPYGLSFDPNYVYAPNQGMRLFAGIRFTLK